VAGAEFLSVREASLNFLRTERPSRLATFHDLFALIDRCIGVFEKHGGRATYPRICGLTTLKAKNLALGSYSLILDGLGQEAGALLRPLIEYIELLTYFRKFPEKTTLAPGGDLPRAGERAKAIGGMFKGLREHLNEHASHSSYSHHSLAHLVEPNLKRFRRLQRMHPKVLDKNFTDLAVQAYFLLREAVFALERVNRSAFKSLGTATDKVHQRIIEDFELDAP
jgi:hypothetical protein